MGGEEGVGVRGGGGGGAGVVDGMVVRRWMEGGRWRWWSGEGEGKGVRACVAEGVEGVGGVV